MKVGINGFGRIGRLVMRAWVANKSKYDFEIVAINDIGDPATMAFLFKHDSTFGKFHGEVKVEGNSMVIDGHKVTICSERDPANLPWKSMGVDYVLESTGLFTSAEKAEAHLKAGAKKVIISAPAKGGSVKTIVMGVNHDMYDPENDHILSNASCTTNCLAPVMKVINDNFKVVNGLMTTIHSYTNDQRILDQPHKDLRRARSAAVNIIPTSTGAARAIGLVIPELKGKIDGLAIRVPTPDVSLVDLVVNVEKSTTKEEVNSKLKEASGSSLKGIMGFSEEPLVSIDFVGESNSGVVDADNTYVIDGNVVKVLAWYDNEWGYSTRCLDLMSYMMKKSPAKV